MPIYEYYCTDCRAVFEAFIRGAAPSAQACPKCGGSRLNKMLSTFAAPSGSEEQACGLPSGICACGAGGCGAL